MPPTSSPTVVCGVDATAQSRCAARVGAGLAAALGAPLVLVHVTATATAPAAPGPYVGTPMGLPGDGGPGTLVQEAEAADARAEELLGEAAEAAGAAHAERVVVPFGDPARRLAAVAEERDALLLVAGTRDQGALRDSLVGSVSGRLAADAPCPVLLVGPRARVPDRAEDWRAQRIVCGFDGSENALRGAGMAAALAARLGSPVSLVQVVDATDEEAPLAAPDLVDLHRAAVAALPGDPADRPALALDVRREVRHGDPAEQLERVAAAGSAPLIVVGTRGRPPWRAALLGSVSRAVAERARRPVLLVPPGAQPWNP